MKSLPPRFAGTVDRVAAEEASAADPQLEVVVGALVIAGLGLCVAKLAASRRARARQLQGLCTLSAIHRQRRGSARWLPAAVAESRDSEPGLQRPPGESADP